jgi:hypothetical protein
MAPERLQQLRIRSIVWPMEKEALLGMLCNRECTLLYIWEELEAISDVVMPPRCIHLECGHIVWQDGVFRIPKKVIPMEKEMIIERVPQGLFELAWGL